MWTQAELSLVVRVILVARLVGEAEAPQAPSPGGVAPPPPYNPPAPCDKTSEEDLVQGDLEKLSPGTQKVVVDGMVRARDTFGFPVTPQVIHRLRGSIHRLRGSIHRPRGSIHCNSLNIISPQRARPGHLVTAPRDIPC